MTVAPGDQPFVYEIRVYGQLNANWSGRVNEMSIALIDNETWLIGRLADQAALLGVLTTLYDWGYSIISVRQLRAASPVGAQPST